MSYQIVPGFEHVQARFHREIERTDCYSLGRGDMSLTPVKKPTLQEILKTVAVHTGVSEEEISGSRCERRAVEARHVFALMARKARKDLTSGQVGQFLNKTQQSVWGLTRKAHARHRTQTEFQILFGRVDGALGYPCDD